jgi:hypothetical protein
MAGLFRYRSECGRGKERWVPWAKRHTTERDEQLNQELVRLAGRSPSVHTSSVAVVPVLKQAGAVCCHW